MRLPTSILLPQLARLATPLALLALAGCGMPMRDIRAENRAIHWSGNVAACEDGGVLGAIQSRFASAEAGSGHADLGINEFTHIRQISLRRNGPAYIPQRGCVATAHLSNNTHRKVYYAVVSETGIYSIGDGVEFCVEGHDHYHLGPPACSRMIR